jgi:hypothetical protein
VRKFIEAHEDRLPAEVDRSQYATPREVVQAVMPLLERVTLQDLRQSVRSQLARLQGVLGDQPWVSVVPEQAAKSDYWFSFWAIGLLDRHQPEAVVRHSQLSAFLLARPEVQRVVRMDHASHSGTQMRAALIGGKEFVHHPIKRILNHRKRAGPPCVLCAAMSRIAVAAIQGAGAWVVPGYHEIRSLTGEIQRTCGPSSRRIVNSLAKMYPEVGRTKDLDGVYGRRCLDAIGVTYFDIKIPDELSCLSPVLRHGQVRGLHGQTIATISVCDQSPPPYRRGFNGQ